jgi:hypothetical protein
MKNLIPLIGESKRRKKMKRNSKTKYALGLLALTLATTSIVGGTFAKYVTADSIKDEARVAKWGVVISGSGNLFSDAYINQAGGNTPTTWNSEYKSPSTNTAANITVSTAKVGADNLVAPGTKNNGDGLNFKISGTPEVTTELKVDVSAQDIYLAKGTYATLPKVSLTATEFATEKAKTPIVIYTYNSRNKKFVQVTKDDTFKSGEDYYKLIGEVQVTDDGGYKPVKYTYNNKETNATAIATSIANKYVGQDSVGKNDTKNATDTDKTTAVVSYSIDKTFNPNTELAKLITDDENGENKISWIWEFESASAAETVNKEDTILGNLMASKEDSTIKVVAVNDTDRTLTELSVNDKGIVATGTAGKTGYNEYASIRTSFDITITATQVD